MEPEPKEEEEFYYHEYDGDMYSSTFPADILDRVKETVLRDEDLVVVTYPKCATTWMQAIVSLIHNDADFKDFDDVPVFGRFSFLESQFPNMPPDIEKLSFIPPPHLIKTHLNSKFFEKTLNQSKAKFIILFRNPKDVLVSYYHFYRMNSSFSFNGEWNDFFELFRQKKLNHGDYFDNVLSWWKYKDDPRLLILHYEDMLKQPQDAIKKVAKHMGKSFSDETIFQIVAKTSFSSMKDNPMMNYKAIKFMNQDISPFLRKGKVGDWKNFFSPEQAEYVDKLVAERLLPVGLKMTDS